MFFFLQTDVSVAFGTEIHGGGATKETAVVGAESVTFGSLASVFFGHVWICVCVCVRERERERERENIYNSVRLLMMNISSSLDDSFKIIRGIIEKLMNLSR